MATSSFKLRKLKTNRQQPGTKSSCLFSVNRSPVTTQKRDISQFEDYRQRAFIERMKDAFRTVSFRSEPTIGEESLVQRSNSRRAGEVDGQVPCKNGQPVMDKKCEELVQNLVPDCYEHIQNFHHYRSDMAKLDSGFKVLYLSGNDKAAKNKTDLKRVYGQKSRSPKDNASAVNGHYYQMLPGRKIKSTRMANTVSKKVITASQNGREKQNKLKEINKHVTYSGVRLDGKDAQKIAANSTEMSLNDAKQPCDEDQRQFNTKSDLEHASVNYVEDQPSLHRLESDICPKPPMTTPDDMSRRSSIRTLVFESEVFANSEGNRTHKDSNQSHHYLAPFNSRFPHLKSSSDDSSFRGMRQKRCSDTAVPSWQQYRILCDAFRPNFSPEEGLHQKNHFNSYKRPNFATTTELEYYIEIVSETDNNCTLHMS